MSVSTFIFTTPKSTASLISWAVEPEPPWKTRSNGRSLPTLAPTASWISFRISGRSLTEPGSKPFDLVFHGGSGSTAEEIAAAVDYGVVKMNVDTDTQYAFTRPVAGHMLANYDGVLKIDDEVGNKKLYDPRAWGKAAEAGMAARVGEACEHLRSAGKSLSAS